ncbi:MAG: hypothetical protein GY754_28705 [bacterium]|nr:hypothetical protein [bacterium]
MKLYTDPMEITVSSRMRMLREHLDFWSKKLGGMISILEKMETIIGKIEKTFDSSKESGKKKEIITQLVEQLDGALEKEKIRGRGAFSGTYGKFNPTASIWFRSGTELDQRERMYINTITSDSLHLKQSGKVHLDRLFKPAIEHSLRRVGKTKADLRGYRNRIELMTRSMGAGLTVIPDVFLKTDVQNMQLSYLRTVDSALLADFRILRRLMALAADARDLAREQKFYLQVEVSQLVDEIDRVASQSSYNHFNLFAGYYSDVNPRATNWFITERASGGRKRIYIKTMTAQSLGMRDRKNRSILSICSDSGGAIKRITEAVQKVRAERERINEYISYFEKEEETSREVRVVR